MEIKRTQCHVESLFYNSLVANEKEDKEEKKEKKAGRKEGRKKEKERKERRKTLTSTNFNKNVIYW